MKRCLIRTQKDGPFPGRAPGRGTRRMHPASPRCAQHLPRPGLWGAGTGAGAGATDAARARPRWASAGPQLARRSPGRTAAQRPERAGSAPARPHPMDSPGSQPGDGRSERTAAELWPRVLTPDAATVRPPGEGEMMKSSSGDLPRGPPAPPGGGSAARAPPRAPRHRGGGTARFSQDLVHPPAGQSSQALQELEKRTGHDFLAFRRSQNVL